VKASDLCREHGISEATSCHWNSKYGALNVSEAQRLRQMEDKNRCLKQLVADLSVDGEVLKAVIQKNGWSLQAREWGLQSSPSGSSVRAQGLQAVEGGSSELPVRIEAGPEPGVVRRVGEAGATEAP
jgi:putative transposase